MALFHLTDENSVTYPLPQNDQPRRDQLTLLAIRFLPSPYIKSPNSIPINQWGQDAVEKSSEKNHWW